MILNNQSRRKGSTLVESACVISVFLLFSMAIFEYGRFVMIRHILDNAAREGARLAVVSTNSLGTADIVTEVNQRLAGHVISGFTVQVYKSDINGNNIGSWSDAAFGECICVKLNGTYSPMLPTFGFLPSTVNVPVQVIMRSEANN